MSFTRKPGSGRPLQTSHRQIQRISRFNLSSDDKRVRVWRLRSKRLIPAFALQRPTASTADVMVRGTTT
ncbi:hypothetical protein TNCV_3800531 [Trichonephila clavipes]|nr:hypothetical protein TNCV_3800531 [Trichonephila clavipes]